MNLYFRQVYIQPGADFPFSHHFQRLLSEEVTALTGPSSLFVKKYAADFKLIFNVSAKRAIEDCEIRGPGVFRKTKDVEYTIFLPFDVITRQHEVPKSALTFLLDGVCAVLQSLEMDTSKIIARQESLIQRICADPTMFEADRH